MRERKAFSLIELAIVLVIFSILFGIGLKSCLDSLTNAKVNSTKEKLTAYKLFLIKEFCSSLTLPNVDSLDFKDAWGNSITVAYYSEASNKTISLCSLDSTTLSVILPDGKEVDNIVAVLISPSADQKLDSIIGANLITLSDNDLFQYISLYELKSKCCKGRDLEIITNVLPPIVKGEDWKEIIVVRGGTPPYRCEVRVANNDTLSSYFENGTEGGSEYCYIYLSCDNSTKIDDSFLDLEVTVYDNSSLSNATKVFRVPVY
ncbi:MAG: prepilin-type N-terminal cleavage/methylation domain-containing protein [Desulfurobacteriaceae bacterium]